MRACTTAVAAAAVLLLLLAGAGTTAAQSSPSTALDDAYHRWLQQLAVGYTYEAAVEVQTAPAVSGTIRATFNNGTATSVEVMSQTPSAADANGTTIASYATAVSAMFTELLAGTADAAVPVQPGAPRFDATYGYPTAFVATSGALIEYTVRISSLSVTAIDQLRQGLLADNAAALSRWDDLGWASYHYITQTTCGLSCGSNADPQNPAYTRPVIVNVHTGSVVSALDAETREQLSSFAQYRPIPAILAAIARHILTAPSLTRFAVQYDARLGVPLTLRQAEAGAQFDATTTTLIRDPAPREVEPSSKATPRWVFAIVILVVVALIACLVGFFCCRKKGGGDAAPTDRTMARTERKEDAAGGAGRGGAAGGERSAAGVDYGDDSPVEMRPRQQQQPAAGGVQYEV
uniref:Uncharacterized protein n=1 Tax=Neobodo designis TaxID=312471 RepID=A0A7S1WB32_NEODS